MPDDLPRCDGASQVTSCVPRPFKTDERGVWKHGFHQGIKSPLSAPPPLSNTVRQLHASASAFHDEPKGGEAPSAIFISKLDNGEGQAYHVTQTLAEGACGKFRIATSQGRYMGVKEYRLRDKGIGHTLAVSNDDIEREWAASQTHNPKLHVHDVVQVGHKVFVMTDLLGQDLTRASRQISKDRRAIFVRAALLEIAQVLVKMHACEEVHLDVKPANALVGPGFVTLCDFGSVLTLKQLESGCAALGTPAYFAPERWRNFLSPDAGIKLDDRVDVWSLAMSWCHMHHIGSPFDRCELGSFGATVRCLNAYEQFYAHITRSSGRVDKDFIRHRAACDLSAKEAECDHTFMIYEFYVWANTGLNIDETFFEFLLAGPLQAAPGRRSTMTALVDFLQHLLSPSDMKIYSAVTHRLVTASEYHLDKRGTTSSTPSSRRSHTLEKVKSELQASFNGPARSDDSLQF